MVDVADLSATELQELAAARAVEAGLDVEVARCTTAITGMEARIGALQVKLVAVRDRLAKLNSGEIVPPPYRPPIRGDQVVSPPTGELGL